MESVDGAYSDDFEVDTEATVSGDVSAVLAPQLAPAGRTTSSMANASSMHSDRPGLSTTPASTAPAARLKKPARRKTRSAQRKAREARLAKLAQPVRPRTVGMTRMQQMHAELSRQRLPALDSAAHTTLSRPRSVRPAPPAWDSSTKLGASVDLAHVSVLAPQTEQELAMALSKARGGPRFGQGGTLRGLMSSALVSGAGCTRDDVLRFAQRACKPAKLPASRPHTRARSPGLRGSASTPALHEPRFRLADDK